MFVVIVLDVVAEEDVVGGDMVITHMDSPSGTEHLWQRSVYNLHNNGVSSPLNKRIIFKK